MRAKTRGILIVVCVLLGALCLMGAGPNVPAPAGRGGEPSPVESAESGSVLVEAFVVEVNLPALAQLGVSPIGRQPRAVSVADILKCLDSGQARVIGGEKIAGRPRERMRVETKRTIYVRQEKGGSQVIHSPYASGGEFTLEIKSATEATVSAGFSFATTRFTPKETAENTPPITENWEWSGAVTLPLGAPQIAGATQDGASAVFLLLTANAQDEFTPEQS